MTLEDLRDAVAQEEGADLEPEMLGIPTPEKIIQGIFILVDLLGTVYIYTINRFMRT